MPQNFLSKHFLCSRLRMDSWSLIQCVFCSWKRQNLYLCKTWVLVHCKGNLKKKWWGRGKQILQINNILSLGVGGRGEGEAILQVTSWQWNQDQSLPIGCWTFFSSLTFYSRNRVKQRIWSGNPGLKRNWTKHSTVRLHSCCIVWYCRRQRSWQNGLWKFKWYRCASEVQLLGRY